MKQNLCSFQLDQLFRMYKEMTSMAARIGTALSTVTLLLAVTITADAQQLKVGYVDFARLIKESPQARESMRNLQDEFAPREREIVAQQKELQGKEEQLQRDVAVMGDTERRAAERDIQQIQRDLARDRNEYLEDLNLRRNEELDRLQRGLLQQVQTYAQTGSYDLIVSDGVVFASSAIDITPQILAGLEASFQLQQSQ
ncbi:MAG: OmpH family outer membrane protein [Gammaproteobacteria bacterium]